MSGALFVLLLAALALVAMVAAPDAAQQLAIEVEQFLGLR